MGKGEGKSVSEAGGKVERGKGIKERGIGHQVEEEKREEGGRGEWRQRRREEKEKKYKP